MMSGLDIIEIPGYTGWYARRCAVEAWQRAGSPRLRSAGRLYAAQKYLYDGYRAKLPGFNPADNPDDEWQNLAHVRFVAFDLYSPTPENRAAMERAGFVYPYWYEPWHAELPHVRTYAIVRTIPILSVVAERPLGIRPRKARSKMSTLFVNVESTPPTFALAGDGEGPAAWLEFTDQQLANDIAGFHGISQKAVPLGDVSFGEWRAKYLAAKG